MKSYPVVQYMVVLFLAVLGGCESSQDTALIGDARAERVLHPEHPHVVMFQNNGCLWVPAPGYVWYSDRLDDFRVKKEPR